MNRRSFLKILTAASIGPWVVTKAGVLMPITPVKAVTVINYIDDDMMRNVGARMALAREMARYGALKAGSVDPRVPHNFDLDLLPLINVNYYH